MSATTMQELLTLMCDRNASDLLLTAGMPPQLRLNGLLVSADLPALDPDAIHKLAYGILNEKLIAQFEADKNLDISRDFNGLARFRMNIFFQRESVAMAIRKIPMDIPSFEELGLPHIVKEFSSRPHGLVLITGPAGSGKSTTLAAMIDFISRNRQAHVICIEDPIEYMHGHHLSAVEQREIGADVHSFGDALRSVFRQSPDVIMVGEMRDPETMQLVLSLAETGHLILATLHTQDTTHSINRIVDSFPPGQQHQVYTQLALVLVGVMSQQLIITKDGKSRVLACEVMYVNNAIRNLIREMQIQQINSVIQTARAEGMQTMDDALARLCEADLIDVDVALSRSSQPKEMTRLLQLRKHK